jgi:Secretion system C-terminal sorting domain
VSCVLTFSTAQNGLRPSQLKTMKKLSWLILWVGVGCFVCHAQQNPTPADSVTDPAFASYAGIQPQFINVSATIKDVNKVWLQWDIDSAGNGDYFIVERSSDDEHYETIGAVRETGAAGHYELLDAAPPNGSNFYRIKCSPPTGPPTYSKSMQLSLSGKVDFKFYPNPVDKLFIVQTEHIIDLLVLDAGGVIRLSKRLQPGIQVVNVSTLEKGVYVLRVTDKESNRAISQQLVKN